MNFGRTILILSIIDLFTGRFIFLFNQTARHVIKAADSVRIKLEDKVKKAFSKWGGAISLDAWLDKTRKVSFFGMTIHFIDESCGQLELNDRILCTREMDADVKDGAYIKSQIKEHLKSFHIYSLRKKMVFVSDRGSNMVAGLKDFDNIHCFTHMLNNTVQLMLGLLDEELKPTKRLVKYFKVTGLNSKLKDIECGRGTTLKSFVATRWNSVYYMIRSVLDNWTQIRTILEAKNGLHRIENINIELLEVSLISIALNRLDRLIFLKFY